MSIWESLVGLLLALALLAGGILLFTAQSDLVLTSAPESSMSEQSYFAPSESTPPFHILSEYQGRWLVKADSWTGLDPYTGREYPILGFYMSPGLAPVEDLAKWESCEVSTCETERFALDPGLWAITVSFTHGEKGGCEAEVQLGEKRLTILQERDSRIWNTIYLYVQEPTYPCFLWISCPEGEWQYWQAAVEPVYPWMRDYEENLQAAYRL